MSALAHEQAGFKVIGTTSWGIANSLGYNDGENISFNDLTMVVKNILRVVSIPLTVDIESGYSETPDDIIANVKALADMGCSGINIEDSIPSNGLKEMQSFANLVTAIKKELLASGFDDFCVNVRIDTYLNLDNPLEETLVRAKHYEQAGADGFFVPCMCNSEDITALLEVITIPLNVMSLPNLTDIASLTKLGVKRFSYGNAMSDCIVSHIEQYAKSILNDLSTDCLYKHDALSTKFL